MISICQQESKSKSLSCHVMHSMIRNSNFQLYLDLFPILCFLFLCFLKKLAMQCTCVPVKVISLPRKFICQSEKVCLSSVLHSVDWFSLIPGHIMHMLTSFCLKYGIFNILLVSLVYESVSPAELWTFWWQISRLILHFNNISNHTSCHRR